MNTKKATYMDILMRLMAAIQNNRILQGISKGFVMAMPIIFMGSFALVIKIIPVTAWKEFVSASALGWTIKMPESVPPFVSNSFKNIIPSLIILSLFTLVNALFSITPFEHVHQFVFTLIQTPLQNLGGGIVAMVLVATLCQLVWAFGIHASSVQSVMTPIWTAMDMSQLAAATAGTALPYIIGKQFKEPPRLI